jgi:hypothetical protein
MKTKKSINIENKFIQCSLPISRMMRWWKNQSSENDKGGNFYLDHYLRVSEVISTATIEKIKK